MAEQEVPNEDLATAHDATQLSHSSIKPKQPTRDNDQNDNEAQRCKLEIAIQSGLSETPDFDSLDDVEKIKILPLKNKRGDNVILSVVRHKNVPLLRRIITLLALLQMSHLLVEGYDVDYSNALQIAIAQCHPQIFDDVFACLKIIPNALTDAILHRNFADQNCITLALFEGQQGYKWISDYLIPNINFDVSNIQSITTPDNAGLNTIIHTVCFKHWNLASDLVNLVYKHSGFQKLKLLFIGETASVTSCNKDVTGCDSVDSCGEETLFQMFLNRREQGNSGRIDCILRDFLLTTDFSASELYGLLTSPLPHCSKCPLSLLIDSDCHQIIKQLLNKPEFPKIFWGESGMMEGEGVMLARGMLESHALSSEMIATLNSSTSTFFVSPKNFERSKPKALLFYTEKHTERYFAENRKGASDECDSVEGALSSAGVDCRVLSGKDQCLEGPRLMSWLKDQLESVKANASSVTIVGFTHGAEGIIFDADKHPIAIRDIIDLANEIIPFGIPITFIFQGCRQQQYVGGAPTPNLKRFNLLILTCAEGEASYRKSYADSFSRMIREGMRDIIMIHNSVTNELTHDIMKRQTPELRSCLGKPELTL